MTARGRESRTGTQARLAGPQAPLMMTLSAFAAIDEVPLPDESAPTQGQAILSDLGLALREAAAPWVPVWAALSAPYGSSPYGANLAYLAQNAADASQYAVAIRGTDFGNPTDKLEDFEVQNPQPFVSGSGTVHVSEGAALGHSLITEAVGSHGNTLLEELTSRVKPGGEGATIFITGHSLGGALATMVAFYLKFSGFLPQANFQVYTFAAPTAGLTDFAELFDSTFSGDSGLNSSWRAHNAWDIVPQAWEKDTLSAIQDWYPQPGPAQNWEVRLGVEKIIKLPGDNPYQQPAVNECVLNENNGQRDWTTALKDPDALSPTKADFEAQVGFQHDCNTYLYLMGAPTVTMLAGLQPSSLQQGDGPCTVTLSGLGFSKDSSVAFSSPGITVESTALESQSQLTIQVSVAPDAKEGPCDVMVSSGNGSPIPGGTSRFLVVGGS